MGGWRERKDCTRKRPVRLGFSSPIVLLASPLAIGAVLYILFKNTSCVARSAEEVSGERRLRLSRLPRTVPTLLFGEEEYDGELTVRSCWLFGLQVGICSLTGCKVVGSTLQYLMIGARGVELLQQQAIVVV